MFVGGVDFSGARDPSGGLYAAEAALKGDILRVHGVYRCDDRLDLFERLRRHEGFWGLDFPFSLSEAALQELGIPTWWMLLEWAATTERGAFLAQVEAVAMRLCEGRCEEAGLCCRATESAVRAYSPLKQINPSLRTMIYSGFKLLHYLIKSDFAVFPLYRTGFTSPAVAEVYPSHTWRMLRFKKRSTALGELVDQFNARGGLQVLLPDEFRVMPNQDAADAVVACITIADAVQRGDLTDEKPLRWTDAEWMRRDTEGGIVRLREVPG